MEGYFNFSPNLSFLELEKNDQSNSINDHIILLKLLSTNH